MCCKLHALQLYTIIWFEKNHLLPLLSSTVFTFQIEIGCTAIHHLGSPTGTKFYSSWTIEDTFHNKKCPYCRVLAEIFAFCEITNIVKIRKCVSFQKKDQFQYVFRKFEERENCTYKVRFFDIFPARIFWVLQGDSKKKTRFFAIFL